MKKKIILSCVLMLVAAVISLLISYNVHCLLSGSRELCTAKPAVLISGLGEPRIRTAFLILLAAAALAIVYMLVMQSYIKYRSDMRAVTPDILTPKAEGQGQYGTARWLESSEFDGTFSAAKVDSRSLLLKELAYKGDEDLERRREPDED